MTRFEPRFEQNFPNFYFLPTKTHKHIGNNQTFIKFPFLKDGLFSPLQ